MANRGPEVELLVGGTDADAPSKGSVALNMLRRQNAWEVRKGFGQVVQLDTLMAGWVVNTAAPALDWIGGNGYRRVLGSTLIKTKRGNRQIVTVLALTARTGSVKSDPASVVAPMFAVSIYDLDSGGRWEEPVYRHTAENTGGPGADMTHWHGAFESTRTTQYGHFERSTPNDDALKQVWFTEINDILYFGNSGIGLMAYLPVPLRKIRRRQQSTHYRGHKAPAGAPAHFAKRHGTAPPYSECCFLKRVTASPPSTDSAAAYTFLDQAGFPSPSVGCRMGGRLVLASGRSGYISESGFPGAIAALNTFVLPTDEDITAMHELGGNLYVFTENETWLIQPSPGVIVTKGRMLQIGEGIGCSSASSIVKVGQSLMWLDSRGVYRMTGVAQIERISDPIEPFFTGELSNPINNYFTDGGHVLAAQSSPAVSRWPMPRTFYRHSSDMVNAAYNERLDAAMFSFPSLNTMIVYAGGQWAVWPLESIAREHGGTATVGALDNIRRPWVMADETDVFITCGMDEQYLEDQSNTPPLHSSFDRSICHLRYGRGGAVDRSIEDEDHRMGLGAYIHFPPMAAPVSGPLWKDAADGGFYFHEPIPIQYGRVFTGTPNTTVTRPAYWIPVEMVVPSFDEDATLIGTVTDLHLVFTFDNTHWQPIFYHQANSDVNAMFPPERTASITGYAALGTAAPTSGQDEFRVYGGGVVAFTGDTFGIHWDGSQGTHATQPHMNACPFKRTRLFYIPMMRKSGGDMLDYTVGFNISIVSAYFGSSRFIDIKMPSWVWSGSFMGDQLRANNSVAQPVDFAYKSGQIGVNDDLQHKLRGTYGRMLSHSKATTANRVSPNWPVGIYNTVMASDFKGWVSQIIDVAPAHLTDPTAAVSQVLDTETIRTRYLGSDAMSTKVFAADETGDHVHYGDSGATGTISDTYLVDDEEVDVIAVSDSVKGAHVTVMIWGMLRNKAERLAVESVKAVIRAVGGRRRGGH